MNMMLALFNLLTPIFPLDSAKLVRALLSFRFNPQKVTYYLAWGGLWLGVLIIFASLLGILNPILGRGGPFLFIIMIVAVQVCSITIKMLEYENVYSTYDQWGAKPVYYDAEQMLKVRMNLQQQLGWTGMRFGSRIRKTEPRLFTFPDKPKPATPGKHQKKEPAKLLVAAPSPEKLSDPDEIRELMQTAAENEDFALAARLKRRLQEIEKQEA
jgi:UvrB/uvrC motif